MTFARYMELCLYHPEHGYYMQGRERTGVGGDYFTNADLHPIFARLIARQAAEMWEILGRPARFTWVEMGAGRGLFALDFLEGVNRAHPTFAASLDYVAVEPGPHQQDRIRERLARAQWEDSVRLVSDLGGLEAVTGCFFSNELADAFPVSVVTRLGGRLKEIYVDSEGDALHEKPGPISDPAIAKLVARYASHLEEGQRVEVTVLIPQWMRTVAEKLARGFMITIDYGDLAGYLYTSDRPRGTLLAYRGHRTSEDFYNTPGECDLTAHTNFSALIDCGEEAGLHFGGFVTQEQFLMALGAPNEFADLYHPGQGEIEKLQSRLRLKRLLDPTGMGSVFNVLIQHRGLELPALTGLKYARRGS